MVCNNDLNSVYWFIPGSIFQVLTPVVIMTQKGALSQKGFNDVSCGMT